MSKYLPELLPDVMGHTRYHQCFVSRPYGDDAGQPYVNFREERILENVAGKQTEPAGECGVGITDDNEEEVFDILNPGTGEPTGKVMTYAELLAGIDSLYIHVAIARDEAAAGNAAQYHGRP